MLYGSVLILIPVLILIGVERSREIELEILSVLLRYGEMYGLQIADVIEQDFGRKPGWGVLYPGLRRLLPAGSCVTARWGEEQPEERGGARRRYYQRTGKRTKLKDRKLADLGKAFSKPSSLSLKDAIAFNQILEMTEHHLDY